jgi:hypothetical protein
MNAVDNSASSSSGSFMTATMEEPSSSPDVEEPFYIPSAELYNEPQVYDAVVIPDDQDSDDAVRDPKAILHLRLVQLAIVLFSLTGITMVIFSLTVQNANDGAQEDKMVVPTVEGWSLVGDAPVFGPMQDALFLFGTAVAMSGHGQALAVAAPGTDQDEEHLLVGAIHIFKEIIQHDGGDKNGTTKWDLIQSLPGPGPNRYPSSSLAMDRPGQRVAAGYPRFQGGKVQLYEQENVGYGNGSSSSLGGEEEAAAFAFGGDDAPPRDLASQAKWISAGTLVRSKTEIDASTDPWFGYAVELTSNGQYLAVGSPLTEPVVGEGGSSQHGAVYFYQHKTNSSNTTHSNNNNNNNKTWTRLGTRLVGGPLEQHLGWSLCLCTPPSTSTTTTASDQESNTSSTRHNVLFRVAIGAPTSIENSGGVVRVHELSSTTSINHNSASTLSWRQIGPTLIGSRPGLRFGESVAMSDDGTVLAVGARGNALFDAGQVQVFRLLSNKNNNINSTDEWMPDDQIFQGHAAGEGFGAAVSLSADGNILAIGGPVSIEFGCKITAADTATATTACDENTASGRIMVFNYDSKTRQWTQQGSSLGGSDATAFGSAVALSADGQRVAGGAPQSDFDGMHAGTGSVLVYNAELDS